MARNLLSELAEEKIRREKEKKEKEKEKFKGDKLSVTHHVMEVDGKPLRFKAVAGYMDLKDDKLKLKTRVFYISYEREDVEDHKSWPVTFAFNGGPGAASAWVHFGAMGPKRLKFTEEGVVLPPPYRMEDNDYTWLRFTDLVFFDPTGTGFSIPGKEEDPVQFYGVKEDIRWAAEFIRKYVSKNSRWLSPKYIAGESYGTYRAAGLADYLQKNHAMDVNGLLMISSAVKYQAFDFESGIDLPYVLAVPSYASVAWYHKRLPPDLQENREKTLKEVEKWALEEYSVSLLKGNSLSGDKRREIIKKLARYTTLKPDFIDRCNLRVSTNRFRKKLLEDEKKVLGVYDARLIAHDVDPAGDEIKTDPSLFNVYGGCIAALNDYLKDDLKYENELPYRPLSDEVGEKWNWQSGIKDRMGYIDLTDNLAGSISYNPYLRVFFACGYFDLCTPYLSSVYTVDHMNLSDELRKNVVLKMYDAGHMMYVHLPSRIKLFEDLKEFFEYRFSVEG